VQALLWGIGRTAAIESPARWGGLIDLAAAAPGSAIAEAAAIVDAVIESGGDHQIALRSGGRFVARLEAGAPPAPDAPPLAIHADKSYLITGGLGMLGMTAARWLVDRGARHLVLVSRHAADARASAPVAALEAQGAQVRLIAADVAVPAQVRRILRIIEKELPPLGGIVHSAGVLADGILGRMDWRAFTRGTSAKMHGAWLLHDYTRTIELDFFLMQSSLLGLLGSPGQANYTAANAFIDALVDARRAQGLPATAINWGPWAESGMAASAGSRGDAIWRQRGISLMSPDLGRAVLDYLAAHPTDHLVATICDWRRYVHGVPVRLPLLERLAPDGVGAGPSDLRERLANTPAAGRRDLLITTLGRQLTRELGFDRRIDSRQPLQQLGVDSLMSVNLANRLEATLGIRVPVIKLLRNPSLEGLADDLLSEIADPDPGSMPAHERRADPEEATVSVTRGRGWLVFPQPRPAAAIRLFCFNYAGGGAATYRPWGELLPPSIELVAIEPPGRGSRIDEPPILTLSRWLDQLLPEMRVYLDKPVAFFGHCLGGLTLFETARRLLPDVDLRHVFVSGCRPPHRLNDLSLFEEELLVTLTRDDRFDPLAALHQQPETVFATIIRQFDIGVTDEFLARDELRHLLLPAVRADFQLTHRYRVGREAPWDVPISCFNGLDDTYVTRESALEWNRYTQREFRLYFRKGTHFLVAEDRDFIVSTISSTLANARKRDADGRAKSSEAGGRPPEDAVRDGAPETAGRPAP
jgi:surfactin synthase thioesterase subunit/NAD(P)-dependent dehydrogenase (short-subunit alcohol dehydrogenase family)/acyl carrier protein